MGGRGSAVSWPLHFILPGKQVRKSNSRQQVPGKNGKTISIKSQAALEFTENAIRWLKANQRLLLDINVPLLLDATIYYDNIMADLSDELLCDVLEKGGVVRNDNLFREKRLIWMFDEENPRCDISISPLIDYPSEWVPKYKSEEEKVIARLKRKQRSNPKGIIRTGTVR